MPRVCTVCAHSKREEIDRRLAATTGSKRGIARHFGLTPDAVERHAREHLPATLSQAARIKEIARADDLVPRMEKAVDVAEEVMDEARGMKFDRVKAGHLALHATRRIQSGLGTLSAAVERRKAREAEDKQQDLEGVRARVREKLAVLRERMLEELERQMTEEVERRLAERLAQGGAPEKTDTPAAKPTGPGVH